MVVIGKVAVVAVWPAADQVPAAAVQAAAAVRTATGTTAAGGNWSATDHDRHTNMYPNNPIYFKLDSEL